MKAAKAALDGNDQYILNLSTALKAARERKKVLRAALQRETGLYKAQQKAAKAASRGGGASGGGRAAAAAPKVRRYVDNYVNRKLNRVGKPIPPRTKSA